MTPLEREKLGRMNQAEKSQYQFEKTVDFFESMTKNLTKISIYMFIIMIAICYQTCCIDRIREWKPNGVSQVQLLPPITDTFYYHAK